MSQEDELTHGCKEKQRLNPMVQPLFAPMRMGRA